MDKNQIRNQIKVNKVRMAIGILSIIFFAAVFFIKAFYTNQVYTIIIAIFTVATIFLYIVKPYRSNKVLEQKLNE